ncbi:MAG: enoyl-CoA hydratase [Microbacteriaceae bacterium]|nr:enoyl-CoA hydratase [Microbacteriaceae bacterium]
MTGRRLHEHLVEDRTGPVRVVRIEREQVLGALSRELVVALGDYLEGLRDDTTARVLVLTGTGRGFIAGADIAEYHRADPAAFDDYQRLSRRVFTALGSIPQITIAAVNGYALGGGFEVALSCDLILAAEKAKFGLPEVKLGLLPGGGGTQRLARAVNPRFAKEAVLTGRMYPAAEMLARGVVNQVHPGEALLPAAIELAETIARHPRSAVTAIKQVIDEGAQMPLDVGWSLEQRALSGLFRSEDGVEGIAAFLEKREPRFSSAEHA